jgi:FixJ family two-component response regulator
MPGMIGVKLAKKIRATRPMLPVILVTGRGSREILSDFGEARILQKPYSENKLTGKIAVALS